MFSQSMLASLSNNEIEFSDCWQFFEFYQNKKMISLIKYASFVQFALEFLGQRVLNRVINVCRAED